MKKLKTKRLRYLNKNYQKDPNRFLKEVVYQWGINWPKNIHYLVCSCIYAPMRHTDFEYGFMHKHLGQMVDVAYIIFLQCKLKPLPKEDVFHYSCEELIAEIEDDIIFPSKMIRAFFGFKTLKEWYKVLDDLHLSRDVRSTRIDESCFGLDCIPILEFLAKLPGTLLEIHERGGLRYALPDRTITA